LLTDKQEKLSEYLGYTEALLSTMEKSLQAEDPGNLWKYGGYWQYARKYNLILANVSQIEPINTNIIDVFDIE